MTTRGIAVLLCWTCATFACTQRTPEMQLIHDAAEAMGGENTVVETETLLLEGEGRQYRPGQGPEPDADLPYWALDEYRREIDLVNDRWRVDQTRTSWYLTSNPILRQEQTIGIDGDVAYDISEEGLASRVSAGVVRERRAEHYHHPVALIQLALADGSTVTNLRQEAGNDVVDITSAEGETYTLYVDSETRFPSRIVSSGYSSNLGDVMLGTSFEDYWETGGFGGFQARLTLPRQITSAIDDVTVRELNVTSNTDQDLGDLGAPEEARSAPVPQFQADVQVEDVADGVWLLGGQIYHSVLVELDAYLALVEAPQHDARTLAVIETARQLQPDKPLRYVVNTHHHFDHAGGVRAAVSEGLTVITHATHAEHFEEMVHRAHTHQLDALARAPRDLSLELVEDEVYELGDGRRTMQFARMRPQDHAYGMLVVYLPHERILIEADMYTPNSRTSPFAATLLETVNEQGWRVDRIVPIHGEVVEMAALEETVEAEAAGR